MGEHENLRATAEARAAAARSAGPVSRHDLAMLRYLGAMQHAGHGADLDDSWSTAPTLGPSVAATSPAAAAISATSATAQPLSVSRDDAAAEFGATAPPCLRVDLVVAGVDGSEHSRRAADWAAAEASRRHAGLRLVFAYSLPIAGYAGYSMAPDDLGSVLRAEGRKMLVQVAKEIRTEHPGLEVHTRLFQGDAVAALRQESGHARLTVVGSRGNGRVTGALLGSVAMAIASHGTAPVAIIPAEAPDGNDSGPVVVGVDGSCTSEAAVRFAFEEAAVRGTELMAVHTWNQPRPALVEVTPKDIGETNDAEQALLSEALAGWRDKYPDVPIVENVVRGRATPTLLTYARYAQLMVVGTRGRGGFAGMVLGSTSHSLISHARCPVVVVRPDSLD